MVWVINRLRPANAEPISVQWSYVPVSLALKLDEYDLSKPIYYIFLEIVTA